MSIFTLFIFHYLYSHTVLKIGTVCRSALFYKIRDFLTHYIYSIKWYIFNYNTNYNVKCNIFTKYFTKIVLFKQLKLNLDISIPKEIIIFWLTCIYALNEDSFFMGFFMMYILNLTRKKKNTWIWLYKKNPKKPQLEFDCIITPLVMETGLPYLDKGPATRCLVGHASIPAVVPSPLESKDDWF